MSDLGNKSDAEIRDMIRSSEVLISSHSSQITWHLNEVKSLREKNDKLQKRNRTLQAVLQQRNMGPGSDNNCDVKTASDAPDPFSCQFPVASHAHPTNPIVTPASSTAAQGAAVPPPSPSSTMGNIEIPGSSNTWVVQGSGNTISDYDHIKQVLGLGDDVENTTDPSVSDKDNVFM